MATAPLSTTEGQIRAGRYRIGQLISGGGMGNVYQAHDTRLGRSVAFKVIKPELLHDTQFRARLRREAIAAAAISHPNIAQALDYVDEGNEAFIVYEYVEGMTLRKRLAAQRFTTEEIRDVGIKLADALAAAHDKGFIHRDLKPENVMLIPRSDGFDRVKILDFGLVKRIITESAPQDSAATTDPETFKTTGMAFIGTIDYMAPEQLRMEPVDHRADLYALGLILYEMATGVNPFRGGDTASTIANILTREPPALGERSPISPPQLDHVVQKCLSKNRQERYQSARELRAALEAIPPASKDLLRAGVEQELQPAEKGRILPRGLLMLIQAGYLTMYTIAAHHAAELMRRIYDVFPSGHVPWLVIPLGLVSAATHLYFLAAVGFDYEDFGRLFRRTFPFVLVLDAAWAASPLLLVRELGALAGIFVVGLAFLPFSQMTLVNWAYAPRSRDSGARGENLK